MSQILSGGIDGYHPVGSVGRRTASEAIPISDSIHHQRSHLTVELVTHQHVVADEFGVTLWFEAFADRAYDGNGYLVSRSLPGAVHHDPEQVVAQAITLARGESLRASDGTDLPLKAHTLCVHGDNPGSIAAVKRIREALEAQ